MPAPRRSSLRRRRIIGLRWYGVFSTPGRVVIPSPPAHSLSTLVAAAGAGVVLVLALVLAGGPIATADFWWHLKMGEVYAAEGLWPAADPMLHTAHADAPIPHEWLFSVGIHAIDLVAGFWGLRLVHALAVAGILVFVYVVLRRERAARELVLLAALCFFALALNRLMQLRADLVSIPATFAVYAFLIAPREAPSWRSVLVSGLGFLVWANLHPVFGVGLILLLAALLGIATRAALALRLPTEDRTSLWREDGRRAQRLAAALGLGLVASLVNPRGADQLLTFQSASTTAGISLLGDEWVPFEPLDFGAWVSGPTGTVADLLLLALPVAGLLGFVRFWRHPSRERLEAVDPVRFALGFAGLCAYLIAIRFLWMGGLAFVALLRVLAPLRATRPRMAAAMLAAGLSVALAVPLARLISTSFPSVEAYLETPYSTTGYHVAGVRFLRHTSLEGNLFNPYTEGGFEGYWLAPRLRTFVDGRTDHFSTEVLEEYLAVRDLLPRAEGRSPLEALGARNVDVFFGVGLPLAAANRPEYTLAHLERAPGWIPVFRAVDLAIYLRRNPRNGQNVRRVAAYYAKHGIPFDPARGFEPAQAIAANPGWAIVNQVVPVDWRELVAAAAARDEPARFAALGDQALVRTLLGDYEGALALDREALSLRPDALAPRRRQIFSLLHLGRADAALAIARSLREAAPDDPRHSTLEAAAARLTGAGPPSALERTRVLAGLPLLTPQEAQRALAGRYNPLLLKRR